MTQRLLAALAMLLLSLPAAADGPTCERGSRTCEFRRPAPVEDPLAATPRAAPAPRGQARQASPDRTGSPPSPPRAACQGAPDGKRRDRC